MNKIVKVLLAVLVVVFVLVYLYYAISFGLQLSDLAHKIGRIGFREALTSPGSSDMDFYASITWLVLIVICMYIVPLALIIAEAIHLIKKRKRRLL